MKKEELTLSQIAALCTLDNIKRRISQQAYRTIRGQIMAGDVQGALTGIRRIEAGR